MAFRKYQKVESAEPVSPEGHEAIQTQLHKVGKTSMVDLSESERQQVTDALDEPQP